jgi:predicted PurR-regulated permease PerM
MNGRTVPTLAERLATVRGHATQASWPIFALLVAVVVVATLYVARVVLIPVALAVLFTFLLAPVLALLERIRLPRAASAILVVMVCVTALGAFGWSVAKQLVNVTEQLPNYTTNIRTKIESIRNPNNDRLAKASNTVEELRRELAEGAAATPSTPLAPLAHQKIVPPTKKPPVSASAPSAQNPVPVQLVPASDPFASLPSLLGPLETAGIVVVFTFFMLLEREDLRNRLIRLAGQGRLKIMTEALDEAGRRLSRYLLLQTMVNITYGGIIGVALYFIGIPNALLWGAIAAILRFLPYIGPPIGALLPITLSLAVFDGWSRPLMTIGTFAGLEIAVSNFVEPFLYGGQTGVTPIGILFAAIFWTTLWGPIGLLLSTPLTVCLVVMGRHIPRLAFLQIILGDEPVLTPDARFYQRLLAMDQEEARQVLEQDFKDKPLSDLYDSVLVPALSLVEQDRHRDMLDEATERFIFQSTKELVEEQFERSSPAPSQTDTPTERVSELGNMSVSAVSPAAGSGPHIPSWKIICVPARDEADEIVAMMLVQLLQQAGYSAQCSPLGNPAEMLEFAARAKPDIVCISALPPFALAHARTLYRKLREYSQDLEIVLGLWGFSDDADKVAARIRMGKPPTVCATLSEAVEKIRSGIETEPTLPIDKRAPAVIEAGSR